VVLEDCTTDGTDSGGREVEGTKRLIYVIRGILIEAAISKSAYARPHINNCGKLVVRQMSIMTLLRSHHAYRDCQPQWEDLVQVLIGYRASARRVRRHFGSRDQGVNERKANFQE
jgi:hypothetical protein